MTYNKDSKEWKQIIAGSDKWFSKSTMDFFNSEIYWETLYKIDNDNFYFISSEDNFDKTQKLFSIRKAIFSGRDVKIETEAWQEFEKLADADFALAELICAND